jgi:hypothetical protein
MQFKTTFFWFFAFLGIQILTKGLVSEIASLGVDFAERLQNFQFNIKEELFSSLTNGEMGSSLQPEEETSRSHQRILKNEEQTRLFHGPRQLAAG